MELKDIPIFFRPPSSESEAQHGTNLVVTPKFSKMKPTDKKLISHSMYQILEKGDIYKKGDEFYSPITDEWKPVQEHFIGTEYEAHSTVRRKILGTEKYYIGYPEGYDKPQILHTVLDAENSTMVIGSSPGEAIKYFTEMQEK